MKPFPAPCTNCAQAQDKPWRTYSPNCPECDIRCIANMDQKERAPLWEQIERECGRNALFAIKERVGQEIVRMKLLKEGKTK